MKWWWVLIVVLLFPGSVEASEGAMSVHAIGTWELIALHIPLGPSLWSATMEVTSDQGRGFDAWESYSYKVRAFATPARTYKDFPLEKACYRIAVRPPYWQKK